MTAPTCVDLLSAQLRHCWTNSRWVIDGLTDDEYWWEPAPGCWSVRARASGRRGWGQGEWVVEDAWPAPDPLPVTTIAWRLGHLVAWTDIYRRWAFTDERPSLDDAAPVGDAADAVAQLIEVQDAFVAAVASLAPDEAFQPRPAHWGESVPIANLVTVMLAEHVHHLGEIGTLRDIKRGAARPQPMPTRSGESWWTG